MTTTISPPDRNLNPVANSEPDLAPDYCHAELKLSPGHDQVPPPEIRAESDT